MKKPAKRAAAVAGSARKKTEHPVISDHQLVVNFGRHCRDNRPTQVVLSMTELASRLCTPDAHRGKLSLAEYLALDKTVPAEKALRNREKDGAYFIPAEFVRAGTRAADDIRSMSLFAGDIDKGNVTKQFIQEKLKGLQYIAYSSYSHQPSEQRWRFIVPHAKPVTRSEHEKVYAFMQAQFDGLIDPRCKTTNQIWYTAACPHDAVADFEFFVGSGEPLDVENVPSAVATLPTKPMAEPVAEAPLANVVPPQSLSIAQAARLKSALLTIASDDRQVWIKVGLALRREVGQDHGLVLWLDWSGKSEKFDRDEALVTWATLDTGGSATPVTLGTVFHLAKESGWVDTTASMPDCLKELDRTHFMAMDGGKSLVCREAFDPELGREYLDRCASSQFKDFNSNQFVRVPQGDDFKKVNKALAWLTHPARRSFQAISFLPGKAAPVGHYNLWRGFAVSARAGDWSLLRAHIVDVICGGDHASAEYLLDWMAFGVQHPDKPAEVAVVMQGSRGTGKGKLASMYGKLFGQHALQITQIRHLTGNFNAHLRSCVFLFADEALWAGDKAAESVLKGLITERTLQIEGKGANNVTAPNRLHIMMASNNDWVVPAGPGERRFFVLRVGDQYARDHAYFAAIDKQMLELGGLSAMMYDLMRRDLTKVDIRKMPRTAGLDEQVLLSLEPAPLWWIDHLGKTYAPGEWKFQSRNLLRFGYSAALGANLHGKSTETRFGMFLKSVLPGGALKKVQHATHGTALDDCYELPDQAACKMHLMQKLGLQNDPWV